MSRFSLAVVMAFAVTMSCGCTREQLDRIDPPVCANPRVDCTCMNPKLHIACSDNWFEDLEEPYPHIGATKDSGVDAASTVDSSPACDGAVQ